MKNTQNFAVKLVKRSVLLMLVALSVSACNQLFSMKVIHYADKDSYQASSQALASVDRAFYAALHLGEWDYQGSNASFGEVRAFIKIPQQLNLAQEVQQQYIQQIICPSAEYSDLWYKLKNIDLEIHLYTNNRNRSISATCVNPFNNIKQV